MISEHRGLHWCSEKLWLSFVFGQQNCLTFGKSLLRQIMALNEQSLTIPLMK